MLMILDGKAKLYLLPFIYYFTLSLTLIFVSSYWLISRNRQAEVAYAQGSDLSMEIKLSGLNEEEIRFVENNLLNCDNVAATKINEYYTWKESFKINSIAVNNFVVKLNSKNLDQDLLKEFKAVRRTLSDKSKVNVEIENEKWSIDDNGKLYIVKKVKVLDDNSQPYDILKIFEERITPLPLANHGCVFTAEAQKNNLDPYLTAAIAMCESGGGASKTSKAYNNPFGWGINDSESTRNDDVYVKDSLSDSIAVVSAGIARNAIKRNLGTNPSEIVTWYNPGSVDRANGIPENSTWAYCVNMMMNKIAE